MATAKFYRVECDKSQFCGTVGTLVGEAKDARKVANRNGIKRVAVAKFKRRPEPVGPTNRADTVYRDLCPRHLARLLDIRMEVVAERTRWGYIETAL